MVSGSRARLLVLVHGSMCDHTTFDALVDTLSDDFSTFAVDRRGFGASPDGDGYSADREFDDVAAVVDAVADRGRRPGGALRPLVGRELRGRGGGSLRPRRPAPALRPTLGLRYPPGVIDRVESLVEAGDNQGAVVAVLTEIAGMADEDVAALRGLAGVALQGGDGPHDRPGSAHRGRVGNRRGPVPRHGPHAGPDGFGEPS